MLAEEHYPLPERTQQTLEHALLNAIAQFIDSYQRKLRELIAISVILPGLVDPDSGKIHYMPHIQVENWGLVEALEERFKVTCFVGHDIRSLALAEHYFGASQIAKTPFWCVSIAEPGPGLSLTGEFLSGATATSVKLAIFRSNRWVNAATAATLAAWKLSPPMLPLNNGC